MISQSSRGSCSVLQLQYLTKLDGQVQCAGLCHAAFAQTRALPESCDDLSQSSNAVSKNWIPLNSASFPHFWSGNYCPLSYQNYSLSGRIPWREGRGEMSSQRRGVRRCSRHIGLCSCDRMGKVCRWQNWLRWKAGSRSFWENAVLNSGLQFGLLPQTHQEYIVSSTASELILPSCSHTASSSSTDPYFSCCVSVLCSNRTGQNFPVHIAISSKPQLPRGENGVLW